MKRVLFLVIIWVTGACTPPLKSMDETNLDSAQNQQWTAQLNGNVSDDGLPLTPGSTTMNWEMVSGPAEVEFESKSDPKTKVKMSVKGIYVLRLVATDGEKQSQDETSITIE